MDIETLVKTYITPVSVRDRLFAAKIVLLAGISGAGKDTIKHEVLKSPLFRPVVSHTTRAPRANNGVQEVDGKEYHFVTEDEARALLEAGGFIEAKYVHGTIYGTSVREVIGDGDGRIALTDVDVQGVAEYAALSKTVVPIFIVPPSYEIWVQRLSNRYATEADFNAEWPKRRASAIYELSHALQASYYRFIVNDEINHSAEVVADIAQNPSIERSGDEPARQAAQDLLDAIRSH